MNRKISLSIFLILILIFLGLFINNQIYNHYTTNNNNIATNQHKDWYIYDESRYFISLKYPKNFKLVSDVDKLQLTLYPQPQPIEFGPFMTVRVIIDPKNLSGYSQNLIDIVKNKYKDEYISSEETLINNNKWVHAKIKDGYFNEVVNEYYFTNYRKAEYLEIIFSKDSNSSVFF